MAADAKPARLHPAALPALIYTRWQVLRSFSGAKTGAGKADEAAGLTPGNEDNAASVCFSPEKPCFPLSIEATHFITFDPLALPYRKFLSWVKPPAEDETEYYVHYNGKGYRLADLSGLNISGEIFERGIAYYRESFVRYLCLENSRGRAVVEGTHPYEVEFQYQNGVVNDLLCDCPCGYTCKHEAAVLLQLKETLERIQMSYFSKWKASGYFAIVYKPMFYSFAVDGNPEAVLDLS